ncbi:MAG: trypsin-like serine protease [Deltaproteobacteria bacterium]|nr:trypsin-like serine protease [Deltaproteobacteria bacterium]
MRFWTAALSITVVVGAGRSECFAEPQQVIEYTIAIDRSGTMKRHWPKVFQFFEDKAKGPDPDPWQSLAASLQRQGHHPLRMRLEMLPPLDTRLCCRAGIKPAPSARCVPCESTLNSSQELSDWLSEVRRHLARQTISTPATYRCDKEPCIAPDMAGTPLLQWLKNEEDRISKQAAATVSERILLIFSDGVDDPAPPITPTPKSLHTKLHLEAVYTQAAKLCPWEVDSVACKIKKAATQDPRVRSTAAGIIQVDYKLKDDAARGVLDALQKLSDLADPPPDEKACQVRRRRVALADTGAFLLHLLQDLSLPIDVIDVKAGAPAIGRIAGFDRKGHCEDGNPWKPLHCFKPWYRLEVIPGVPGSMKGCWVPLELSDGKLACRETSWFAFESAAPDAGPACPAADLGFDEAPQCPFTSEPLFKKAFAVLETTAGRPCGFREISIGCCRGTGKPLSDLPFTEPIGFSSAPAASLSAQLHSHQKVLCRLPAQASDAIVLPREARVFASEQEVRDFLEKESPSLANVAANRCIDPLALCIRRAVDCYETRFPNWNDGGTQPCPNGSVQQAPTPETALLSCDRPCRTPVLPVDGFAVVVGEAGPRWKCSGVALNAHTVLTAAHCLPASHVGVGSGITDLSRTVAVSRQIRHPDPHVDAALLKLDRPLLDTVPGEPSELRLGMDSAGDAGGRVGLVHVGYGAQDRMGTRGFGVRRVLVLDGQEEPCTERSSQTTGCIPAYEEIVRSPGGSDTCRGDSGGGVYERFVAGQGECPWRLVAITSRPVNATRAACGEGGIYTRVAPLRGWIEESMRAARK